MPSLNVVTIPNLFLFGLMDAFLGQCMPPHMKTALLKPLLDFLTFKCHAKSLSLPSGSLAVISTKFLVNLILKILVPHGMEIRFVLVSPLGGKATGKLIFSSLVSPKVPPKSHPCLLKSVIIKSFPSPFSVPLTLRKLSGTKKDQFSNSWFLYL